MVSVVILAAGFGTRMKSQAPKVLHKICGKTMLEYAIDTALQVSSDVHVILYNQEEKIRAFLQEKYAWYIADKITLHTQCYEQYPGTGGALMQENKQCIALKGDRVVVVSGDTPLVTKEDLCKLIEGGGAINLAVFIAQNPHGYGRVLPKGGSAHEGIDCNMQAPKPYAVEGIIEEKDCTQDQRKLKAVNAGIYCFEKSILEQYIPQLDLENAQKEYYLTQIIELATNTHSIMAFPCNESNMLGVNTKIHLAQAEQIMLNRLRNRAMEQGVIMQIPESIYLDYDVSFEGECLLENGVRITGKSHIQESHIKAHSVIEESKIVKSDIGPLAHIRPNSVITNSHIGNFVECKSAQLEGVKAGHLSYLGDCVVQEGSNIGAGVITCNYDGKTKHKTHIGRNVFVGSDCQLVAPVRIEDNVLVGAGSTITKDVPEGSLALSRAKQVNFADKFFHFFPKEQQDSQK